MATVPARFWAKVNKDGPLWNGTPCWVWMASTDRKGYGRIAVNGHNTRAHRFAYMLIVGPIQDGLTVDHLCRNPPCVNPEHLEPVTNRDNILRGGGVAAINAKKTACLAGHQYDLFNTYIETSGKRDCRICKLERENKRLPRKR